VHALDIISHLPLSLFVRVLERFHNPGPDHCVDNSEEASVIYCVFMTVTHWDPAQVTICSWSVRGAGLFYGILLTISSLMISKFTIFFFLMIMIQ